MKPLYSILVCIIVIVAGILFIQKKDSDTGNRYSVTFGEETISFEVPIGYFVEKKELGNGERNHLSIILTEDTEENRLVREGKSPGREGPVSITIDLFQNQENLDPETWIRTTGSSNWKLGESPITETTIGKNRGYSYTWSGLYNANSVVFSHNATILMTTVTYIENTEPIVSVFYDMLPTLSLSE